MNNRWLQLSRTTCAIAWARSFNTFIIIYQQPIASMDAFDIVPAFYLKLASRMRKASDANRLASTRVVRQSRVRKIHGPTSNKYLNAVQLLALLIHCLGDMRIRTWTARDVDEARICICRNKIRSPITCHAQLANVLRWKSLVGRMNAITHSLYIDLPCPIPLRLFFFIFLHSQRPSKLYWNYIAHTACSRTASARNRRHRRRRQNEK